MLDQAPSASADFTTGLTPSAEPSPAVAPEAPPPEAPEASGPALSEVGSAESVTAPSAAAESPAPAAPVTPPAQIVQAHQTLQSYAGQLQQGWGALQAQAQAIQARAQGLQSLAATLPPEQLEAIRPQVEALHAEYQQVQANAAQVQQAWGQLGVAGEMLRVQAREAELEGLAGPMAMELLVRQAAGESPVFAKPEVQARMRQFLAGYDATHMKKAAADFKSLMREAHASQRAAAGTDQMGATPAGAAPPAQTTGAQDIEAALRAAHSQGLVRNGRRV